MGPSVCNKACNPPPFGRDDVRHLGLRVGAPWTKFADSHETTIRLALGGLPTRRGNPFRTSQTPTSTVVSAIYDSLTWLESDGSVIPWLATEWRNLDDLTWEFTLRDDVTFSNGAPFNAETVEFMVKYIAGDDADGRPAPGTGTSGRCRATGPYTVEITTKRSMPLFPRLASIMPMVDPEAWQTMGPRLMRNNPRHRAFILQEWTPSSASLSAYKESCGRQKQIIWNFWPSPIRPHAYRLFSRTALISPLA